ncbi:MAG: FAD-dependent oxidoreductase [Pseudomonadota bacterium]
MNSEVAVLGAGVIGLSIAWRLAASGIKTIVIDGSASIPPATTAAAGMLAPSFEEYHASEDHDKKQLAASVTHASLESLAMWGTFAEELSGATNRSVDFQHSGTLGVAFDGREASVLEQQAFSARSYGLDAVLFSRDDVFAFEPGLSRSIVAGLYVKDEGQVDPVQLLYGLRDAVERTGVVRVDQIVDAVACSENRPQNPIEITLANGETIETDRIVVATGANGLPRGTLPSLSEFTPFVPVKGEAFSVEGLPLMPKCVVRGTTGYLCPKSDGRLVVGATEVPGANDLKPDEHGVKRLKQAADRIFPSLADYTVATAWAGVRPGTIDGAPVIGRLSDGEPRIVFALGHYRNGVLLAPWTADKIRDLVMHADAGNDPYGVFSPDRFVTENQQERMSSVC